MKRTRVSDPLTADDVAERLSRAVLRVQRIMMDVRQTDGLYEQVRASRYLVPGTFEGLTEELAEWGIDRGNPGSPDRPR